MQYIHLVRLAVRHVILKFFFFSLECNSKSPEALLTSVAMIREGLGERLILAPNGKPTQAALTLTHLLKFISAKNAVNTKNVLSISKVKRSLN